jgi:hypothetical protein
MFLDLLWNPLLFDILSLVYEKNVEIGNENPKRRGFTSIYIKKKEREVGSQPGLPGSTRRVDRVLSGHSPAGFYLDPDRSWARVGQVPSRPAGPVRVSKLCY